MPNPRFTVILETKDDHQRMKVEAAKAGKPLYKWAADVLKSLINRKTKKP